MTKRETTIGQVLGRVLTCTGCASELVSDHVLLTCWRDEENRTETRYCMECAQWIGWVEQERGPGIRWALRAAREDELSPPSRETLRALVADLPCPAAAKEVT